MAKHTEQELKQWQALPLSVKILMTQARIRGWVHEYGEDGVYVSFSGGKDSTVLLDIVRNRCGYKNVPAVFVDVPTQYPELRDFAKTFDNVEIIRPQISFIEVCEQYGFPFISKEVAEAVHEARAYMRRITDNDPTKYSDTVKGFWAADDLLGVERRKKGQVNKEYEDLKKGILPDDYLYGHAPIRVLQLYGKMPHKEKGVLTNEYSKRFDKSKYQFFLEAPFEISHMCCKVMKKSPLHKYQRRTKRNPMTAQMAEESRLRTSNWIKNGCNGFQMKSPVSNPMAFWTEQDVLLYIKKYLEEPLKAAWEDVANRHGIARRKARKYLKRNNYRKTAICSVYGDVVEDFGDEIAGQMDLSDLGWAEEDKKYKTTGCNRTGCMLCGFGCHIEKSPNRFELLKETHPGMYGMLDRIKNNGVTMREAVEWINEHGNMDIKL